MFVLPSSDDVATLENVLTPETNGTCPVTKPVVVDRPPNDRVGVEPPVEIIGQVAVIELTDPAPVDKHVPLIEKQPFFKLIPPVDENDVVAESKLTTLLIEKIDPGVVLPIPT